MSEVEAWGLALQRALPLLFNTESGVFWLRFSSPSWSRQCLETFSKCFVSA